MVSNKKPLNAPTSGDLLFLLTVGVLFAWSMVGGILSTTVFPQQYVANFGRVLVMVGLFAFIGSKKSLRIVALIAFLAFAGLLAHGMRQPEPTGLADIFWRTFQFVIGLRPLTPAYESIVLWAICGLIGLLVVSFGYFRYRFFVLLATGTVIFMLAFLSPYFEPTNAFIIFILSLLLLLGRHLSGAKTQPKPWKFPMPLALSVAGSLAVGSLLPAPEPGLMPAIAANPFDYFADLFFHLTRDNEFSLQGIGFGGGGGLLGGDVALNNRLFMRVQTHRRAPFYLTGAVMDTYTGTSWETAFDEGAPLEFSSLASQLELLELGLHWQISSIARHYEGLASGRFREVDFLNDDRFGFDGGLDGDDEFFDWFIYQRVFEDPLTGEMFTISLQDAWEFDIGDLAWSQNMTLDVSLGRPTSGFHLGILQNMESEGLDFYRVPERNLFTQRPIPRHSQYTIAYVDPIAAGFRWDEPLSNQRGNLLEARDSMRLLREQFGYEWFRGSFSFGGETFSLEALLTDYLIPRAERIHERYTALPDTLPTRVREYAQLVTEEGETDYERMRLLERYLARNFPYTLTPGPSPRDRDFVDHFLFDLRTGYCVHFATAFVVMARSLGMPTRYVEGFLVNGRPDEDGFIDVTNNMAHAWPEVYFEGYGWQRFEPTPAYGLPQNYDPNRSQSGNAATEPREFDFTDWNPDFGGHDYELEAMMREQAAGAAGNGAASQAPSPDGPVFADTADSEEASWAGIVIWASAAIFTGALSVLFFIWQKQRRLRKSQHRDMVLHLFPKIIAHLNPFASEIKDSETIAQFMARVHIGTAEERRLLRLAADIYTKARYSREKITLKERRAVEKSFMIVKKHSKAEFGILRWRLYRLKLK